MTSEGDKNGKGIFDFADGGRYVGEWTDENGAHGCGICTLPCENGVFEGRWEDGNQQSGIFYWSSGQKYIGAWKDGMRHGLGKEVRVDGTEYSGDFQKNVRGTYGILKLANGALYQGTWEDGLQDGVGVEVYVDKGIYKGQYKKGKRHGYGTRSSSAYEIYERNHKTNGSQTTDSITTDNSTDPTLTPTRGRRANTLKKEPRPTSAQNSLNLKQSSSTTELLRTPPKGLRESLLTKSGDPNAQIYEGQWEMDMRKGHGVLRIPGRYMYFGEWHCNVRTGHGVVVYSDGRKEEGYWENGKLVTPLKRKKLSLKHHQLENKVKQAHTLALQAADMARTKSILAESRASGANGRAKAALKSVEKAWSDAEKAREIYNSLDPSHAHPSIRDIKCPMSRLKDFPPLDIDVARGKQSVANAPPNLLPVPRMTSTPSFEDFQSIQESPLEHWSSSSDSLDSSELSLRGASQTSIKEDKEYEDDIEDDKEYEDDNNLSEPGISINIRRASTELETAELLKSRSHTSTSSHSTDPRQTKEPRIIRQQTIDVIEESPRYSVEDRKRSVPARLGVRRRSKKDNTPHVDQSTGELTNSADNSDDEVTDDSLRKGNHSLPLQYQHHLHHPLDVLTQMANWNKTIAYINFILLIFLLILIIVVVAVMTITLSQNNANNPTSFMTQMA